MSEPDGGPPGRLPRLDPDAAAGGVPAAQDATGPDAPPPEGPPVRTVIDTRRYRWAIGIIGLAVVVAVSAYQFVSHGTGTTGVTPGHRLHWFAAPLATSDLQGDPNVRPPCTAARHDPRALNLCLDARRSPVVLALFVLGSSACERQVSALQTLAGTMAGSGVRFEAVAVDAGHAATARAVRAHHWTIPVAYDRDGAVGALYGVAVCPMAELAGRGGIVRDRLIGDSWQTAARLAPRVRALLAPPS